MKRIFILTSHDKNMGLNEANKGVTALIITAIESLKKFIPDCAFITCGQFSQKFCETYNLSVIKQRTYQYKVLSISQTIKSILRCLRAGIWYFIKKNIHIDFKILLSDDLLRNLRQSDIILVFIQDTFSDNRRILSIVDHFFEISTAFLLNDNVMIWNASIGPLKKRFTRKLATYLFNKSKAVTVRERKSYEYLLEAGIDEKKLHLFPDTVFLLEPASESHINDIFSAEGITLNKNQPVIGISIGREFPMKTQRKSSSLFRNAATSLYNFMEYCLPDNAAFKLACMAEGIRLFSKKITTKKMIFTEIIDYLAEKYNATILLIPHIIIPEEKGYVDMRDERNDALTVFKIVENKPNVKILRGVYTTEELKGITGRLDMLIGMRMHICVASVSQFIPTLAITYNYKFYGMMEFVDQQQWIADTLSKEKIVAMATEMWENRNDIKSILQTRMPQVEDAAHGHAEKAAELIRKKQHHYQ